MNRPVKSDRLIVLSALLLIVLCVYFVFLYKLQIIEGEAYSEKSANSLSSIQQVTAARGNILDRYGRVLVSNQPTYNIVFNEHQLLYETDDPNAEILKLISIVKNSGAEYTDTLPITKSPPFEYTDMTDSQKSMLTAYIKDKKLDANITAVELMSYMRSRYKINDNYSAEDTRTIAGIRYEINARYSSDYSTASYIFVKDADMDLITRLLESGDKCVTVQTSYKREYSTAYAAHILGSTGMIYADEAQKYKDLGYSMNATVGKDGAELAFESYLHGKDGTATITTTADGTVTDTVYTTDPEPGDNVYLTIDEVLQEATENALAKGIAQLKEDLAAEAAAKGTATDEEDTSNKITGGAAVVVDVKTGEPLAMASWPTYDLSTLSENFTELSKDTSHPLFNRALSGTYAPGSTFKPCTAIAALTEGVINTNSTIVCNGVFTKYADTGYAPKCWYYSSYGLTHGAENVVTAIRDSCNIFFYTVGDEMGIDKLDKYAALFGLGESTGIELPEDKGNMADPETHKKIQGADWYNGDTVQAAIGQSDSLFTPLQIAEYCAAIANGGERHTASILKTVRTYDYGTTVFTRSSDVLSKVDSPDYNWKAVQQGMYLVANHPNGTAYKTFHDYKVRVAAKTGTAQTGSGFSNNGVFMCYAPYDDPQVAIAVVVEHAGAGASLGPIAKDILNAYLDEQTTTQTPESELTILK
jgi:penicillin-binding protein 2